MPQYNKPIKTQNVTNTLISHGAVLSVDFSGNLTVVKTKPGYAGAIAWDIDNKATQEILGTIAGDDTILLVPREGVTREEILDMMNVTFSER